MRLSTKRNRYTGPDQFTGLVTVEKLTTTYTVFFAGPSRNIDRKGWDVSLKPYGKTWYSQYSKKFMSKHREMSIKPYSRLWNRPL